MLPAYFYNKRCKQSEEHWELHVYMHVLSVCSSIQLSLAEDSLTTAACNGYPVSHECQQLPLKMPQATVYWVNFTSCVPTASAAQRLSADGFSALLQIWDTLQMCDVVHYWGHGALCLCKCNDVCSPGVCPNVPSYSCLFALWVRAAL